MSEAFRWQIKLDPASAVPVWSQIVNGICNCISRFRPVEGTVVVSERQLASELGIHRNTVRQAYADLRSKNIIINRNSRSLAIGPGAKALFRKSFPTLTVVLQYPLSRQLKHFSVNGLDVFSGIVDRAAELGISVNVAALPDRNCDEHEIENWLDNHVMRSIGVINFGPRNSRCVEPVFERLIQLEGVPQVLVGAVCRERPMSSVCPDCEPGFRAALEYIARKGHRHLGIFSQHIPGLKFFNSAFYRGGILEKLSGEYGIRCTRFSFAFVQGESMYDELLPHVEKMLAMKDPPTVVWGQNDHLTAIICRIFSGKGVRVPEDISAFGFDNDTGGEIASVNYSRNALGAELVNTIWALYNNPPSAEPLLKSVNTEFFINKTIQEVKQ